MSIVSEKSEQLDRIKRFQNRFDASETLERTMAQILPKHGDKLKIPEGAKKHDLALLACAMFGKANKIFHAVIELCSLGYGEDALVLLRTNLNLVIEFLYILKEDSLERASGQKTASNGIANTFR